MISFTVLILTILAALLFVVVSLLIGGASFLVMFGDIILCAVFIVLVIRYVFKRKDPK